jgi:hypothetical protein
VFVRYTIGEPMLVALYGACIGQKMRLHGVKFCN